MSATTTAIWFPTGWRGSRPAVEPLRQQVRAERGGGDTSVEEQACARAAQEGDPEAFDRVIELFSARIYTHLVRIVRNREDAEDLTQETFLRAYRALDRYDANRPFRNWIYTIATNVGLNALRARKREWETDPEDLRITRPVETHPAELFERRERLAEAVGRLPAKQAMLVHLHYHEGLTLQEAGDMLGLSEGGAKVTLHRARKRLRQMLVDSGES